ncbi:MAG: M18 family aminopeptidase [Lachnospiraceae bacterium]|nr:M18 family aminopeptidase [Lachnospiraceae bacterium]
MNEQNKLFALLKAGVTPFHVVEKCESVLKENGFENINYEDTWKLEKGGKYVLNHHGTTLFAFTIGENFKPADMLRMAAAHTDYPCFRIKPNADFVTDVYAQINVEVYGGPILNTWFDRPLGVAGRVALRSDNPFEPKMVLYKSEKPILIIPNLAIHMNREVNKGVEINNQVDLMPILDMIPEKQKETKYFLSFLAKELGVKEKDILDFELCVFCMEEPCYIGVSDTMISSPRLDNQTSVSALISAIMDGERKDGVNLIALFDHEEIGNTSKQGAASIFLHDMTKRILYNLGATEEEVERSIYKSMLLSVDVAHGLHPNKQGKMDITNKPVLGKGFCIKQASSQSYATDAQAVAILCQICDNKGIPYQRFVNRSDVRGGGTLGSVASTLLPMKTIDLGIPILAMHSVRELMGAEDMDSLKNAVTAYFSIG